jgi:hypothetical protein
LAVHLTHETVLQVLNDGRNGFDEQYQGEAEDGLFVHQGLQWVDKKG